MARVDLKQHYRDDNGKLYRAGRDREVPDTLASRIRSNPASSGADSTIPTFDVENATRAELESEADRRGITVTRSDGKDGAPLVDDFRSALR